MDYFYLDENGDLQIRESIWTLLPFKALLKRDKSRHKETAKKEVAFVYHYAHTRSTYLIMEDLNIRCEEIKKDIGLPIEWQMDSKILECIALIESRRTVIEKLYFNTIEAVNSISEYLSNTSALLAERDNNGKPVHALNTIVQSVSKIKQLITDYKDIEKEYIREVDSLEGKKKGSREFNMFEDGL